MREWELGGDGWDRFRPVPSMIYSIPTIGGR